MSDLFATPIDVSSGLGLPAPQPPVDLVSLRVAASLLDRPLAQVQLLSAANLLGPAFRTDSAVFHSRSIIEDLAGRPVLTKRDVIGMGRSGLIPGDEVLVIRQVNPHMVEDHPDREFWERQFPTRTYHGFDLARAASPDAADRLLQADATRMWWAVSPSWRRVVERARLRGEGIATIISVGGLIVGCSEVSGFEEAQEIEADPDGNHVYAFTLRRPEGEWPSRLAGRWLRSGPGRPLLWWSFI